MLTTECHTGYVDAGYVDILLALLGFPVNFVFEHACAFSVHTSKQACGYDINRS